MAISLADPGGPIEAVKESSAAIKTVLEAAKGGGHGEFVQALAADVAEKARQHQNPMSGFKPKGAQAREYIVDELRAVNALLIEKTTPEEAAQFREWLKTAAQRAASAAKEGGFLGFHAQRVSEGNSACSTPSTRSSTVRPLEAEPAACSRSFRSSVSLLPAMQRDWHAVPRPSTRF